MTDRTETPRTDAACDEAAKLALVGKTGGAQQAVMYGVMVEHARQLERELSAARDRIAGLEKENVRLRAAVKDARNDARDAATESKWQERQGDDYGSY